MAFVQKALFTAKDFIKKAHVAANFYQQVIRCSNQSWKRKLSKKPVGRPSKCASEASDAEIPKRGRAAAVALPDTASRFDMFGHWPEYCKKKNKCRLCKVDTAECTASNATYAYVLCKCNICLRQTEIVLKIFIKHKQTVKYWKDRSITQMLG